MRANRISAVAGTLAAAAVVLTLAARSPAAPKVDYRELAHRLVSGTAQVHAGDMVLVAGGGPRAQPPQGGGGGGEPRAARPRSSPRRDARATRGSPGSA